MDVVQVDALYNIFFRPDGLIILHFPFVSWQTAITAIIEFQVCAFRLDGGYVFAEIALVCSWTGCEEARNWNWNWNWN